MIILGVIGILGWILTLIAAICIIKAQKKHINQLRDWWHDVLLENAELRMKTGEIKIPKGPDFGNF